MRTPGLRDYEIHIWACKKQKGNPQAPKIKRNEKPEDYSISLFLLRGFRMVEFELVSFITL